MAASAPCTKFINVYNYSGLNIGGKSYFGTTTHPHVAPVSYTHLMCIRDRNDLVRKLNSAGKGRAGRKA